MSLRLSDGQKACLRLAARGLTSKEIARETGLTPGTVDVYLKTSFKLLGASNRREAARKFALVDDFQSLEFQPPAVAVPIPSSEEAVEARSSGWKSLLVLPPLGGKAHRLSWEQRIGRAFQVAVFSTIALLSIVLVFAGLLRTF